MPSWKVSKSSERHSIFSYNTLLLRQKMLGLLEKDDVFSRVAKEGAPMMLGQLVLKASDLVVDRGWQHLIPRLLTG